ncbi:MAG: hypothetical protein R3277_10815 [Brumimicrobium sp.]|nr:hypothetical protein [Brumimicrobium sp.]
MRHLFILLALNVCWQTVYSQVKIKHLRLEKVQKMEYVQHDTDDPHCTEENEDDPAEGVVLFEFGGVDPEASDAKKAAVIQELDLWIEELKVYADCSSTHTIIIQLAEGTFLKESDGFEVYSKAYYKKGYALAAERFKARYQDRLDQLLKDKTVVLTDWNW